MATWIRLERASNGQGIFVNLDNVSHADDTTSPPNSTCHLFFGTDDFAYGLEVRGSAESILQAVGLSAATPPKAPTEKAASEAPTKKARRWRGI